MKRTPLKRTEFKQKPSKPMKRTRLKQRSDKTQKLYKEQRIPLVTRLLEEFPICQICNRNPSVDLHEIQSRGRTGGVNSSEWLDPDNILVICRECHNRVTNDVAWAEAQGYLKKSSS